MLYERVRLPKPLSHFPAFIDQSGRRLLTRPYLSVRTRLLMADSVEKGGGISLYCSVATWPNCSTDPMRASEVGIGISLDRVIVSRTKPARMTHDLGTFSDACVFLTTS